MTTDIETTAPAETATDSDNIEGWEDIKPGPNHPNAPAEPTITCACGGTGCNACGESGLVPAWVTNPEITGYPHERG
jgi:hypothetical protein